MKTTLTRTDRPKRRWAQSKRRPDPQKLRAALAAIEEAVEPDVVILYGSGARGTMKPDSDVDLLIVGVGIDQDAVIRATDTGTDTGGGRTHVLGIGWTELLQATDSPTTVHGAAIREGLVVAEHGRCDPESTRKAREEPWRVPESPGERERRVLDVCAIDAEKWLTLAAARREHGRRAGREGFHRWEADYAKSAAEACVMAVYAAEGRRAREDRAGRAFAALEKANTELPAHAKAGWIITREAITAGLSELEGRDRNSAAGQLLRWARKRVREIIERRRRGVEDSRRAGAAASPRRRRDDRIEQDANRGPRAGKAPNAPEVPEGARAPGRPRSTGAGAATSAESPLCTGRRKKAHG